MHSDDEVDPELVVVPFPQLTHRAVVDETSLYMLAGQLKQLGVVAPSAKPHALPSPQAGEHVISAIVTVVAVQLPSQLIIQVLAPVGGV